MVIIKYSLLIVTATIAIIGIWVKTEEKKGKRWRVPLTILVCCSLLAGFLIQFSENNKSKEKDRIVRAFQDTLINRSKSLIEELDRVDQVLKSQTGKLNTASTNIDSALNLSLGIIDLNETLSIRTKENKENILITKGQLVAIDTLAQNSLNKISQVNNDINRIGLNLIYPIELISIHFELSHQFTEEQFQKIDSISKAHSRKWVHAYGATILKDGTTNYETYIKTTPIRYTISEFGKESRLANTFSISGDGLVQNIYKEVLSQQELEDKIFRLSIEDNFGILNEIEGDSVSIKYVLVEFMNSKRTKRKQVFRWLENCYVSMVTDDSIRTIVGTPKKYYSTYKYNCDFSLRDQTGKFDEKPQSN